MNQGLKVKEVLSIWCNNLYRIFWLFKYWTGDYRIILESVYAKKAKYLIEWIDQSCSSTVRKKKLQKHKKILSREYNAFSRYHFVLQVRLRMCIEIVKSSRKSCNVVSSEFLHLRYVDLVIKWIIYFYHGCMSRETINFKS